VGQDETGRAAGDCGHWPRLREVCLEGKLRPGGRDGSSLRSRFALRLGVPRGDTQPFAYLSQSVRGQTGPGPQLFPLQCGPRPAWGQPGPVWSPCPAAALQGPPLRWQEAAPRPQQASPSLPKLLHCWQCTCCLRTVYKHCTNLSLSACIPPPGRQANYRGLGWLGTVPAAQPGGGDHFSPPASLQPAHW
jgi:hypothetical protein